MNKKVVQVIVGLLNKNITKEAESRCLFIGYQPKMPALVKDFVDKRTK